jgi:oligoribonuclease NrnB/cAMP/cGMP phosphodiesterase (DHH superfamily)
MSTHHTAMTTEELEETVHHFLTMVHDGDVEHAEEVAEWFSALGITKETVMGRAMPSDPRSRALWFASWFQELAEGQKWDSMDYFFKAYADSTSSF